MKKVPSFWLAVLALTLAGTGIFSGVHGQQGIPVTLRIEGTSTTLFDGPVTVTDCVVTDTDGKEHPFSNSGICALDSAAHQSGFTYDVQDFGFGLFLKRIGDDDTPADFSHYWDFSVNNTSASVGLDSYTVAPDDQLKLTFVAYIPPSPTPTPSPTPVATPTPSPSPSASVEAALDYLRRQQTAQGDIDGAMTSAWSALAFGAHSERATSIKNGGLSLADALAAASLSSATDIERQILAVRSAGLNPRSFAGQDLVGRLESYVTNNQIGDPTLINDDIFGVLAFLAADKSANAPEISNTVQTILSQQGANGSWQNMDITAAAMQALRAYEKKGGPIAVHAALERAQQYLLSQRDRYGGWGENSATTSWAIQALVSVSIDPDASTALGRYQNTNGGFGWRSSDDVSTFMTAYAVPALLKAPWPITTLSVPTATPVVTATVSPIASPTPTQSRVLGISTQQPSPSPSPRPVASVQRIITIAPSTRPSPSSSSSESPSTSSLPVPQTQNGQDNHQPLMLTIFSVVNLGLGGALTRLAAKLGLV